MKNITIIIACFSFFSATSQIIVNMAGDNNTYPENYLSTGQYYIKDVNNYLDNFVGTWEYVNGNEKFQIILTKVVKSHIVITKNGLNFNLDYYQDGILLQYKKYLNNNLIFESPTEVYPNFRTENGILLKGHITDYGRITKTIYMPFSTTEVLWNGGKPIYPYCDIEKLVNDPNKINFKLDLTDTVNYDKETYSGQPTYSIPNNIILTKI